MFHVAIEVHAKEVTSTVLDEPTIHLDAFPSRPTTPSPSTPKSSRKRELDFDSSPTEASDCSPMKNVRLRYEEEETSSEAGWVPVEDVTLVDLKVCRARPHLGIDSHTSK